MQPSPIVGKLSLENLPERPRMMGDTDVALIRDTLSRLPEKARLIEFGPWLGGISAELAQHGDLHVVDRFLWSDLNAEKFPDVLSSGDSFRPHFEALLHRHGANATVHEAEFESFQWSGGPLDYCLIDGPRNDEQLLACVSAVAHSLTKNATILVKHGLNPAHLDMMALLDLLISNEVLALIPNEQPAWCNIAVLGPGPNIQNCPRFVEDMPDSHVRAGATTRQDALLLVSRLAQLAARGGIDEAYKALHQQTPSRLILDAWDAVEPHVSVRRAHEAAFAGFAEMLAYHHGGASSRELWAPPHQSLTWALRHYWVHHATYAGPGSVFPAGVIAYAFAGGEIAALADITPTITGAHIAEIGRPSELSAVAFLTCGAASYVGLSVGTETVEVASSDHGRITFANLRAAQYNRSDRSLCITREARLLQQADVKAFIAELPAETPVICLEETGVRYLGPASEIPTAD